jgi:ribonuclease BN (tRNA processing enzyme)
MAASVELRALEGVFMGPDFTVDALEVRHPGGALGYRVRERGVRGGGIVYISDNELGDAAARPESASTRAAIVEFARGAAVLIHDATFTDNEYEQFRGWGHSRWTDVLDLAADAGVQRLILFHHSPDRGDDEIDRMLGTYRDRLGPANASLAVVAAAEGMEITV